MKKITSKSPAYEYKKVGAIFKNLNSKANQKILKGVLKDGNLPFPASVCRGKTDNWNLSYPFAPNQLWKRGIAYIPAESRTTYLLCTKVSFTKEWLRHRYSGPSVARDAVRSVENAVLMAFNGSAPEGLLLRNST
jgi:hypothetical protein